MSYSKTCRISLVFVLICVLFLAGGHSLVSASEPHPATVRDISDRAYQEAIIDLIKGARESIVISLYMLVPSEKGPVAMLMNDLEDALARGVSVEIYLNTKFGSREEADFLLDEAFKRLEDKGASINPVSSTVVHHDKVIIVDSRYVVEGSHNWSIAALKGNNESSTLIDSPRLAGEKLSRIKKLPLEEVRLEREARLKELRNPPPLPEDTVIYLPKALLENEELLPKLLAHRERRTFNGYFLIIRKGYTVGRGTMPEEFPVSLMELADELGVPTFWDTEYRRIQEADETLKELKSYGLVDVDFTYGMEEWVTVTAFPGDSFGVDISFFSPLNLASANTRTKYVYLLSRLLNSEGKSLDSYTREELSEKYHIGLKQLRWGIRELEKSGELGEGE